MTAPALLRRCVVLPLVVLLQLLILVTSPLTLAGSAVASLALRSTRPVRSVALVVAFAAVELRTIGRLLRPVEDWDALVAEVLDEGYQAMRRVLGVPLEIESGSAATDDVAASDGLVVLSRHCGPGDSVYVAWLLAVHYGLSLRIVLKSRLRLEPAIDLAAAGLPFCFVGRRRGAARDGVARLAADLGRGDALLLFPEGGNFSWPRWQAAVDRLTAAGERVAALRARRRTHTLPPHLGGALAALAGAPDADVLLVAHSGFSADGRDRPWWRVPINRSLSVRTVLVPAADVPRDEAGARVFLDRAWSQVDTWIEGQADRP